jgi:hypothetical protein
MFPSEWALTSLLPIATTQQPRGGHYIPKLVGFIVRLRNIQKKHQYQEANIIAMDETACWMDMPSSTTIDHVGARSVSLKSTGHDKDHYTVILTAKADGTKLKAFIVKGTRIKKLRDIATRCYSTVQ